jgi:hypothetical protein
LWDKLPASVAVSRQNVINPDDSFAYQESVMPSLCINIDYLNVFVVKRPKIIPEQSLVDKGR